ncbi:hypothetical protein [Candidatus Coxiella mudrowiae]|uniref:hypothetical protein n=1 Tax=Candidatus Coxiella mudrowiae TaxID=2054173 RepID=UPI0012FF0B18|nr:hypothetical protein [Candidatus Coxiella mudrowiae]
MDTQGNEHLPAHDVAGHTVTRTLFSLNRSICVSGLITYVLLDQHTIKAAVASTVTGILTLGHGFTR